MHTLIGNIRNAVRRTIRRLVCKRKPSPGEHLQAYGFAAIKQVDRLFGENRITYFADSGTLLGFVREHGFIPHDFDIDLSVTEDTDPCVVKDILVKNGFRFYHGFSYHGRITELCFTYHGLTVDVFWTFVEGKLHWYHSCGRFDKSIRFPHRAKQAKKVLRPRVTGIIPWRIGDLQTRIPENYTEILTAEYGPGWRVPDPHWTRDPNDPCRHIVPGFCYKFTSLEKELRNGCAHGRSI